MTALAITAARGFGLFPTPQTDVGTYVGPTLASDKALPVVGNVDIVTIEEEEDGVIANESAPFGGVNAGRRGAIRGAAKITTRAFVSPSGNNLTGIPEYWRMYQGGPNLVNDSSSSLVITPAFQFNAGAGASTTTAPRVFSLTKIERNGNVTSLQDCTAKLAKIYAEKGGAVTIDWEVMGRVLPTAADTVLGIDDTAYDPADIAFRTGLTYFVARGITLTLSGIDPLGGFNAMSFEFDPGQTLAATPDQQNTEGAGIAFCDNSGRPQLKCVITQAPEDVNGIFKAYQANTAVTATLVLTNGAQTCTIALAAGRILKAVPSEADGMVYAEITIVPSSVNAGAWTITNGTTV